MLGTGQRVRKRVRCDKDPDRYAPVRDIDGNERKLQRRRSSTAGDLEVVHGEDGGLTTSAQKRNLQSNVSPPSTLPPNSHITVSSNAVLPASRVDTQLTVTHASSPSAMSRAMPRAILEEQTTTSQLNTAKVFFPDVTESCYKSTALSLLTNIGHSIFLALEEGSLQHCKPCS